METIKERTNVYKHFHNGWTGETITTVAGQQWEISTCKTYGGKITSSAIPVNAHKDVNGTTTISFSSTDVFTKRIQLISQDVRATEKNIREQHAKAVILFDNKVENGEIKNTPQKNNWIGQIIFTDGYERQNKRVIYDVEQTKWGENYKSVLLDGSGLSIETSKPRPYSKKFGIGVYFAEGERLDDENERNNLIIQAHESEKIKAEQQAEAAKIAESEAEQKKAYLSQFEQLKEGEVSREIKKYLLAKYPKIKKISCKYETYSGGDSFRLTYESTEEIKEVETLVDSLQYGSFDGMNDIYNNDNKKDVVLNGKIYPQFKYTFYSFVKIEMDQKRATTPIAKNNDSDNGLILYNYSNKAIAIFGNTKEFKEDLKRLGGRFNPRLNHNGTTEAGWIFHKSKEQQLRQYIK